MKHLIELFTLKVHLLQHNNLGIVFKELQEVVNEYLMKKDFPGLYSMRNVLNFKLQKS